MTNKITRPDLYFLFYTLISNMFIASSFLIDGFGALICIGLGFLWLILSVVVILGRNECDKERQ